MPTLCAAEGSNFDLCVVGGAGHVGLPLSILFAVKGLRVIIHDTNNVGGYGNDRGRQDPIFGTRGGAPSGRSAQLA